MNKKSLKVGICGTHGVGKTTIAYKLATELKLQGYNVQMVSEVASTSPLPINEGATTDSQFWIALTQAKRELETSYRTDFIICDRSTLDTFAYLVYAYQTNPTQTGLMTLQAMRHFIFNWTHTYDCLLYVKRDPELPLVEDGVRSVDPQFQIHIEELFTQILVEYKAMFPEHEKKFIELTPDFVFCDYSLAKVVHHLEQLKLELI